MSSHFWATLPFVLVALDSGVLRAEPAVSVPTYGAVSKHKLFFMFQSGDARGKITFTELSGDRTDYDRNGLDENCLELSWKVSLGALWIGWADTLYGLETTKTKRKRYYSPHELLSLQKGLIVTHSDEAKIGSNGLSSFLGRGPMQDLSYMAMVRDFEWEYHYDYLPLTRDRVLLFVMTNVAGQLPRRSQDGKNTGGVSLDYPPPKEDREPRWWFGVYEFQSEWDSNKRVWLNGKWSRVENLPMTFQEPFQVLANGSNYYFITASGKLYRTGTRRILTGRRVIEPVWTDANRPITHFLTDADADRTFLFCKPTKKGEPGVFFELGPNPDPKPYDLSKVKPTKAEEPLKSVLERGRFLADHKLLKNP